MFTHHVPMVLLGVVEPRVQNGRPLAHEGRVSAHVRRQDEVYHTLQQPTNQITGPGHMTHTDLSDLLEIFATDVGKYVSLRLKLNTRH